MSENSQADAAAQPSRWRIENPIETLVGAGVLAAAAAFALFAASSSGATIGESYRINAVFDSATGVSVGTDVRIAGVKVGRVAAIELDTQTYRAKTVLALRDGVELPIDSLAKIDSEGLLGGSFIALEP
ncbi:MAG: MlaD family protein, partial [Pseudomonadota bacterium]